MSTSTSRWTKVKRGAALLVCAVPVCAVAGCDRLPSLPVPPVAAVSNDVVTDQGRGGYNWRLNGIEFELQQPTSFAFVDTVSPEIIKRNLEVPEFAERKTPHKPDGMDDDVYSWFRRYTEAPPELKLVLKIEKSDDVGVSSACFNFEGTRILTVGKKLIEWNVDSGERVKEFAAPIENCQSAAYDRSRETVVLQNAESLVRVSLSDGSIKHTWKPPRGKVEAFVNAREADAQGVVTVDGQLYSLADNFSKVSVYRERKLASKKIAIHPKGSWILGVTEGAMLRWRLDNGDKPTEFMPTDAIDLANCMPSAGAMVDRWVDARFVHECVGTQEALVEPQRFPFTLLDSFPIVASNATVDGTQDWLLIVGEKYDAQGRLSRFVQDLHFGAFDYSVPCPLPLVKFDKVLFDASGERLAFLIEDKLHVLNRRRWVSSSARMVAERVGALLLEGRTDQIELVAKELRAQPVYRDGMRGEDVYGMCIEYLAGQWAFLEKEPASTEIMEAIDKWYQAGSELALCASAERNLAIGYEARGGGYADTVTPQGWATLEERTRLAFDELKRLPDQNKLPARALYHLVNTAKQVGLDHADVEAWLAQSAQLYPYDPMPLVAVCRWLLPRWGGTNGEGAALVAALAERYPQPEGELLYARTALGFSATFGPEAMMYEAGFSVRRILDAVDPLLDKGNATRAEIELMMQLAQNTQNQDLLRRLAEYHVQHFGMPTQHAYQRTIVLAIAKAREDGLAKAQQAKP